MNVHEAFADQARSCRSLGSPLTAALCDMLAARLDREQGPVARRVLDWPEDPGNRASGLPLRLAGGLHRLVLDGAAPALAADYAVGRLDWDNLQTALRDHEHALMAALDRPPQTNEVARSCALVPGAHFALARLRHPLPLTILEVGTSAGLNLIWPQFRVQPAGTGVGYGPEDSPVVLRPDWQGEPPPQPQPIQAVGAAGVDLHPIRDPDSLLAYCWADQPERMARLQAAAGLARARPPRIDQGDAGQWLAEQLALPQSPGVLRLVQHSIAWQYFPPSSQAQAQAALAAAGHAAGPDTPLAHLSMEGDDQADGAALHLQLWDGTGAMRHWHLGRVDFHGRWVRWQPAEEVA